MPKLLETIKHTVDVTIPDKEELTHGLHPKADYILLVLRNVFVGLAVIFFVASFFWHSAYNVLKSIADGAGAKFIIGYRIACGGNCQRLRVCGSFIFLPCI